MVKFFYCAGHHGNGMWKEYQAEYKCTNCGHRGRLEWLRHGYN